jgi:hypothetical protein
MKKVLVWLKAMVLGAILTAGCGDAAKPSQQPVASQHAHSHAARDYRLNSEPAGARGVIDVRKEAKDGEEVVIVGRIAGSKEPLVKGRAAFTIVDLSVEPCEDDQPWVMCCTPKEDLLPAMVLVKFVDDNGRTLTQDARQLVGVKEWSLVVVTGEARRDAEGNLTAIIAEGIYIKE